MKKFSAILIALVAYLQVYAIFPMQITNNSQYDDTDIYIGIIGKRLDGSDIYYNLRSNSASGVTLADLNESVNTLHKVDGDWGYANIFVTLDQIPGNTVYIDRSMACRMFIGFRSPMYLHAFNN